MTIAKALRVAITEEMRRDPTVICIGEDICIPGGWGGAITVTSALEREFEASRLRNTPISEAGLAGAAIGAALGGLRPIADYQYSDFLFCGADQLINQAPKITFMSGGRWKLPLVFRAPVGASTRGAQHAQSPEAWLIQKPPELSSTSSGSGVIRAPKRSHPPVVLLSCQTTRYTAPPEPRAGRT